MTPVGPCAPSDRALPAWSDGLDTAGTSVPEDVLDAVVALLHPHQAEAEVDDHVAYDVWRGVVADVDLDHRAGRGPGHQAGVDQRLPEQPVGVRAALHLDDQAAGRMQELGGRGRAEQPPG